MISLTFNHLYVMLVPLITLTFVWVLFFKTNSNNKNIDNSTTNTHVSVVVANANTSFVYYYYYLVTLNLVSGFLLHGRSETIWFNHFQLNNFHLCVSYLFFFVSLSLFWMLRTIIYKNQLVKSTDYLFSLINLVIFLPHLFWVNTLFTFLFVLEIISTLLLYKLISSKLWFKGPKDEEIVTTSSNKTPNNYVNMVFFQYWVTFLSTIFIVYFYINVFYFYGTTDWYVIQFINNCSMLSKSTFLAQKLLVSIFVFAVFFKLGITPFHLFKVEVYKGIPFLSIFFYTTYYFIVFFLFFIFLLSDLFAGFTNQYYVLVSSLLVVGSVYTIVLLFDVSFLKAFFTYSTIINSIGFLLVFISTI